MWDPLICEAETTKLNLAVIKARHRIKCINEAYLLEPELSRATTAVLSD